MVVLLTIPFNQSEFQLICDGIRGITLTEITHVQPNKKTHLTE